MREDPRSWQQLPEFFWYNKDSQRLYVDTRGLAYGNRQLWSSPNGDEDLVLQLASNPEPVVDAAVVVDLGNTRSFALLVDCLGRADQRFLSLPLEDYAGVKPRSGVFRSMVTLERTKVMENEGVLPDSFVRTGDIAQDLRDCAVVACGFHGTCGCFSPKQVFWSQQKLAGAKAVSRQENRCFPLSIPRSLLELDEEIRDADLFAGLVMEILEQAEMRLNSQNSEEVVNWRSGPRLIRYLAVTYPPAWTSAERREYEKAIQRAADAWCRHRALPKVEVRVSCDEASASLLAYVSCEVGKSGQSFDQWIGQNGTCLEFGDGGTCRFGVIDLGGGTSDLVISEISAVCDQASVGIRINHLFHDGVCKAGDEFIHEVIAKVLLPLIAKIVVSDDEEKRRRIMEKCLGFIEGASESDKLPSMRTELFRKLVPLALQAMKNVGANGSESLDFELDAAEKVCQNLAGLVIESGEGDGIDLVDVEKRESVSKSLYRGFAEGIRLKSDQISEISKACFGEMAGRFARCLKQRECQKVLLVGKTSENPYVLKVFEAALKQAFGETQYKLQKFTHYKVDDFWKPIAARPDSDDLSDVKMTTAMGAALELLGEQQGSNLGFISRIQHDFAVGYGDGNYVWTIRPVTNTLGRMDSFSDRDVVFSSGREPVQVVNYIPCLFYRRRPNNGDDTPPAQVSYLLQLKNEDNVLLPGCSVRIRHTIDDGGCVKFEVVEAEGQYRNAYQRTCDLTRDDFEIRLRMSNAESFWLDSGNLGFKGEIQW